MFALSWCKFCRKWFCFCIWWKGNWKIGMFNQKQFFFFTHCLLLVMTNIFFNQNHQRLKAMSDATKPSLIGELPSSKVVCGGYHTCVLTSNLSVSELNHVFICLWSFIYCFILLFSYRFWWALYLGSNENGCLGIGYFILRLVTWSFSFFGISILFCICTIVF